MKIKLIISAIIGLLMHAAVFAQDNTGVSPEWVSEKGWWVVESNIHSFKHHIVYFYNNDGVLVYKEKLEGVRLKLNKRSTKMRLKKALETTVQAWEQQHQVKENGSLVVNILKGK
ncbi:hypothetical protein [Niastella populi]|uniref:Lipocalin-like domain-containing protein n=1 Tax=Niastella populi TaxID=550983 RepID=A0A1V9EHU5_9BACT|nr:hypothetical protein [Niastella populi]OQP45631.1 hypothetical protein A4R26_09000 [Niastella populi]